MTFVITQHCCNDASCVRVCPAGCIHPTPDEPDFASAEMLYINPADCIDCGACVEACPVDAIYDDFFLPEPLAAYQAINEEYFAWTGTPSVIGELPSLRGRVGDATDPTRVAIVGAGPSGWYVADELVGSPDVYVEVTIFDRVPASHGFVRHGVAPDHQATKRAGDTFDALADHPQVNLALNVDIGTDLTHEELLAHFHAVVYCTGADTGRTMGLPGEDLDGVTTSADFVHWYNGHPDHSEQQYDLDTPRAVIIGNGNVALDIARLMLISGDEIRQTDMADHAIAVLGASAVEEVVVLGRRGAEHAAFTSPELRALADRNDLDIVVSGALPESPEPDATATGFGRMQKAALLRELAARDSRPEATKRLVLDFGTTPVEMAGENGLLRVLKVRDTVTGEPREIETGLVIAATGFRGTGVPGLAFDDDRGRFVHDGGRVVDGADHVTGVYTAGWAKRGPSGVIGTNKLCAKETAASLIDDLVSGRLARPVGSDDDLEGLLSGRRVPLLRGADWATLRRHEEAAGRTSGRPRVKVATRESAAEVLKQV